MANANTNTGRAGARVSESSDFSTYREYWAEPGTMSVQIDELQPSTTYYAKGMYDAGTAIAVQADYTPFSTIPDYMYLHNRGKSQVTVTVGPSWDQNMHFLDLSYSYDANNWNQMVFNGSSASVTVPVGGKVYFRGDNEYWYSDDHEDFYHFSASGPVYGGGNIMTLLDSTGQQDVVPEHGLQAVFCNMSNLITPPDCSRILEIENSGLAFTFASSGITTPPDFSGLRVIGKSGLMSMCHSCSRLTAASDFSSVNEWWEAAGNTAFQNCTSLAHVPDFADASFLSDNMSSHASNGMFEKMFAGCTSLAEMPDLSAISMKTFSEGYCSLMFANMFYGCTSLQSADKLPAITSSLAGTITDGMFLGMFDGCTGLTYADLEHIEYADMDQLCSGMFKGCTSLGEITLNGDHLGTKAYENMFYGCSSLKQVNIENGSFFDANGDGSYSHTDWLHGVYNTGTLYVPQAMVSGVPTNSDSGCPTGWNIDHP